MSATPHRKAPPRRERPVLDRRCPLTATLQWEGGHAGRRREHVPAWGLLP